MEVFKTEKIYNFMGKRIPFLALSLALIFASLVLIFVKGLNWGVDFWGGTIVQIQYKSEAPISKIREELSKIVNERAVKVFVQELHF